MKDGTPCTDTSDNDGAYGRSQCEFDAANSFICNPEDAVIGELNPPDDLPECTADITAKCDNLFADPAFDDCLNVVTDEDGTNKERNDYFRLLLTNIDRSLKSGSKIAKQIFASGQM